VEVVKARIAAAVRLVKCMIDVAGGDVSWKVGALLIGNIKVAVAFWTTLQVGGRWAFCTSFCQAGRELEALVIKNARHSCSVM
jgi:hypothetical protein